MSANASGEFNICLSSGEQHLLRDAAEKSGVSLAGFIRVAALQEAEKLAKRSEVSREESVVQTRKESEKLIESLDRSFTPNDKMNEAMDLANRIIQNSESYKQEAND